MSRCLCGNPASAFRYDQAGNSIYETDAAGNELDRYFHFAGRLVNREEANDWVDHYGTDALGNTRWFYSLNDGEDFIDYYPFGGERIVHTTSAGNNTRLFTDKERDPESGNDNFGARYYDSSLGRFMSPDPENAGATIAAPQSWNAYSYVLNNTLNLTDPTGLWCVWEDGTHDDDEADGGASSKDCKSQGGHWDSFDTITGIFQTDGVVTQINTIYGNCTQSGCGAGMTLEGFDQTLQSYSQLPDNSSGWLGTFFGDLFSIEGFAEGQLHARNTGYYDCLGNKMIPFKGLLAAGAAKAVEEAATHSAEKGSSKIAGAYYHMTDGRFTAWGRSSKVLVPKAAATISKVAKGVNVAGWILTDAEAAEAINACSANLTGNKE